MELLILRSTINTQEEVHRVSDRLDNHPSIRRWTVDLDDCDHVLRIEALDALNESDIQLLIRPLGLDCEDLPE